MAAGIAIAVVGAGLLVSLFYLPPVPTNTLSSSVAITDLGPGTTRSWVINEASAVSGQLTLTWVASASVAVSLWNTATCPVGGGVCPVGSAIVAWSAAVNGTWHYSGPVRATYLLSVTNSASVSQSFTGLLVDTYPVSTPSQVVPAWALIAVGGLVLALIGGTAIFLGVFLESGVYQRPPPYPADAVDGELPERADDDPRNRRGSRTF